MDVSDHRRFLTPPLLAALVAFVCVQALPVARGATANVTPLSGADGVVTQVTVAGQQVWQNTSGSSYMYFQRPASFPLQTGMTLYVRVTYYDESHGQVRLQFDALAGAYTQSAIHTRTSRVNSGQFVTGYFELPSVQFTHRENLGADFRLICGAPNGVPISIRQVTLQDTPFADSDFIKAISRIWQTRFTGASREFIEANTLKGKVMAGYQGWFRAPNDLDDGGWRHWVRNNSMVATNFTVDMWPDLTLYAPYTLFRAGDVLTHSGLPAYVFSSTSPETIRLHFRWMRKHNIDGAFLQRFFPMAGAAPEWVLRHVTEAADREGLIWAIEYDVSGMADATVAATLQSDWQWLTNQFRLLDDPRYAHHGGKPVVAIWGLPFPDRNFTFANANAVVDYFHNQGVYVIGGIPNTWSSLNSNWQNHLTKYDGILVWQSQNFAGDLQTFTNRGQDFYPHTWPGFSWANLQMQTGNTQLEDRQGGQTYWNRTRSWINAGADRLFIGMFDEYDEGTAIMPMTDDPPDPPPAWGRFINNQGRPSDWWMMLTDELKRMMLAQRSNTGTLPTVASLSNRSNIGPEAMVDLGTNDVVSKLSRVDVGDGHTLVETVGGKECRANATPATDLYMYFNVQDPFAYQPTNGDVTIEVEYYDGAAGSTLGLQYDSATDAYKGHAQLITTTGRPEWRHLRFEMADAYFGGRQNGNADFRITFSGHKLNVNRVWVRLPELSQYAFGSGLSATYFDNADFSGSTVSRVDANVDFDWAAGSPDPAIAPDSFSARWTGQLQALASGTYSFKTTSAGGIRLWVNGQNVIDHWADHPLSDDVGTNSLEAGQFYDIQLDYTHNTGNAAVRLFWTPPGGTENPIPQSQLNPLRPGDDRDHDGLNNAAEALAGTDPSDPASALRVANISLDLGTQRSTLTWPSVPGIPYHFLRSSNLVNWTTLPDIVIGDGGIKSWTDSSPPAGSKLFYKITVW